MQQSFSGIYLKMCSYKRREQIKGKTQNLGNRKFNGSIDQIILKVIGFKKIKSI